MTSEFSLCYCEIMTAHKKGFTLVELLVVITIFSILALMGLAVFKLILPRARDAGRRVDIDAISKAWEQHYSITSQHYPRLEGSWFDKGTIPRPPVPDATYNFTGGTANFTTGGDTYKVCADLEINDADYCIPNRQ